MRVQGCNGRATYQLACYCPRESINQIQSKASAAHISLSPLQEVQHECFSTYIAMGTLLCIALQHNVWHCRGDLEQVRILADQCRRREKLRKRALASWQQDMRTLHDQAIAMDQQRLQGSDASSNPSDALLSAATPKLPSGKKKQQGSSKSTAKGKMMGSQQAQQLAADVAEATVNAQAKFEHDMALSLQLTRSVADEAAKLHHVKIVRPDSDILGSADDDAAGPSADMAAGGADMVGHFGYSIEINQIHFASLQMSVCATLHGVCELVCHSTRHAKVLAKCKASKASAVTASLCLIIEDVPTPQPVLPLVHHACLTPARKSQWSV